MQTPPILRLGALGLLALLPATGLPVDFEKDILPIFESKCVECHRASYEENGRTRKPKAGLRMDAAWAILAGSEDGAVLTPGDADASEIYLRTILPEDDDDFMPPTGKGIDPLSGNEIENLKTWITDGADFGAWEGNLKGKPATTETTGEPPVSEVQQTYDRIAKSLPEIEESAWAAVTEAGGRVTRLTPGSPLLSVDFRLAREKATDKSLASLAGIEKHVIHLDLSRTAVTDAGLDTIEDAANLLRLNLSQTSIGDAALSHLAGLTGLRSLNLYSTEVGDAGLSGLEQLPDLEAVYLWNSKVTRKGARQLEKALPDANVVFE